MKGFGTFCAFLLILSAQDGASAVKRKTSLTGEYGSENPAGANMVWVNDLFGGKIHFCLQAAVASPAGSYRTGFAQGDIEVRTGRAVYADNNEFYKCMIVMNFLPGRIEVDQQGGCGCRVTTKLPKDDLCKQNGPWMRGATTSDQAGARRS